MCVVFINKRVYEMCEWVVLHFGVEVRERVSIDVLHVGGGDEVLRHLPSGDVLNRT